MELSPVIYVWHLEQLFNDFTQVTMYVHVKVVVFRAKFLA